METLLAEIDRLKLALDILRMTLDNYRIREALSMEFLYESNRIEGNSLTLRETQLVIQEGITIGGKSMREHLEAPWLLLVEITKIEWPITMPWKSRKQHSARMLLLSSLPKK